jgi:hypothetical protein
MALNKEDKGDIKKHMGKALANKISKVTNDRYMAKKAKKELYDMGKKNVGKEEAVERMKQAFGSTKTRMKSDSNKEGRKGETYWSGKTSLLPGHKSKAKIYGNDVKYYTNRPDIYPAK